MSVTVFGEHADGRPVHRIVIGEAPGPVLDLLDLGATVHRLEIGCGDGERRNVVLGHPTASAYLAGTDYVGATIGRYANRIAGGRFLLDGQWVEVDTHDRGNHLHGGPEGFDRRPWDVVDHGSRHAEFQLVSPAGDQGFTGELTATARFDVTDDAVVLSLSAVTDAPTVVNLTSHAYFNLDGDGAGTVDHHRLMIPAEAYTPVDSTGIPLDGHMPVAGTPFDFREAPSIGPAVRSGHVQVAAARGIDHNYVIDGDGMRTHAVLESLRTRTSLEVRSDHPGLQVYTGNFFEGGGASSARRSHRQGDGIALEPQRFPDSPNRDDFPSAVLRPGETYRSTIEWRFTHADTR